MTSFDRIPNCEERAMLTALLDEYCHARHIAGDSKERDEVGRILMSLYEMGWRSSDELKAMLAFVPEPEGGC